VAREGGEYRGNGPASYNRAFGGSKPVSWRYLAAAAQAVLRAGAIQTSRLGQELGIRHKGEIDIVTEVDRACEEAIVAVIRERFPDHDIVTEEQ
jgi:fructose-1,6-bisphosphatase/inositol monophosphatase family enzyme